MKTIDTKEKNKALEQVMADITQNRKFNGKLFEFDHTIDDIKKSFSQERLGGVCLINFCAGGETLLTPIVIDIIKALLEC